MSNVGSALLWKSGAYRFGDADGNSVANANGQGDQLLNQQPNGKIPNPDVMVNEENSLLNPKKKVTRRPAYDVSFLHKENGLDFVDKHFRNLKFKGKDYERRDLRKLIDQYREWCFIMYPSMNFKDIIKKTQSFSSKVSIKNHLQKLRDTRDGVVVSMEVDISEDEDIDVAGNGANVGNVGQPQNNNNINGVNQQNNSAVNVQSGSNAPQRRLQRQPDGNLDAVIRERAQRGNASNGDNQNNAMNAQRNNNMMDFGMDPMDMMSMGMDFGGDPDDHEQDLARAMYG